MTKVFCKYSKEEIAARMLDTALRLHFESGDGFSIIHLSGAAEEVLAGLIETKVNEGGSTKVQIARERTKATLIEIHREHGNTRTEKGIGIYLNFVRNQTKHHDANSDPNHIALCLELEVEMAINRAIENFMLHTGNLTDNMSRFLNSLQNTVRKLPDAIDD